MTLIVKVLFKLKGWLTKISTIVQGTYDSNRSQHKSNNENSLNSKNSLNLLSVLVHTMLTVHCIECRQRKNFSTQNVDVRLSTIEYANCKGANEN